MNIVKRDIRELTDVSPINFQARQITFYEMKITWNFAWDIEDMLEWNIDLINFNFNKIELNDGINVFDIWWNLFVVEYSDKFLRDNDINLLKQRFQVAWKFSKELEEKRQVPEFDWYFEYEGKYYTIVDWLNILTDEINPEKWVYKWVIVNPWRYFKVEDELKETSWKVKDIL